MKRWTHFGTSVTPLEHTRRRVAGGTAIDIRIHDPRTTATYATVNADNLVGLDSCPGCGRPAHASETNDAGFHPACAQLAMTA